MICSYKIRQINKVDTWLQCKNSTALAVLSSKHSISFTQIRTRRTRAQSVLPNSTRASTGMPTLDRISRWAKQLHPQYPSKWAQISISRTSMLQLKIGTTIQNKMANQFYHPTHSSVLPFSQAALFRMVSSIRPSFLVLVASLCKSALLIIRIWNAAEWLIPPMLWPRCVSTKTSSWPKNVRSRIRSKSRRS